MMKEQSTDSTEDFIAVSAIKNSVLVLNLISKTLQTIQKIAD